jgi:hypothetical protein
MRRLALAGVLALAISGLAAGTAGAADPIGQICGSIHVTVNGQPVVDQQQCQVLPPQS